ncbi:inositol monophosphatase [Candidatus Woesearchaeota archaeon]|nr:inositol monophosphatase [Candidatus Woesearchaeota archaeon]
MTFIKEMRQTAEKAARVAGKIILNSFQQDIRFERKKDHSFVSIVDKECEENIRKIILSHYPTHAIMGEEFGFKEGSENKGNTENIIWHIDPLDGTSNFKNKYRTVVVSIGVEKHNVFIMGVIYNPFTNELCYAEKGRGAFCNGKRLKVSNASFQEGIVMLNGTFRGKERIKRKVAFLEAFARISPRIRMLGSNVLQLVDVANGIAVANISDGLYIHDLAAGLVLVREAGGIVTDIYGNEPTRETRTVIAVNTVKNYKAILKITRQLY